MKVAHKTYKKELNACIKKNANNINFQIRNLKSSKPKDYWNLISEKSQKSKKTIPITLEQLMEHFKNLSNAEEGEDSAY